MLACRLSAYCVDFPGDVVSLAVLFMQELVSPEVVSVPRKNVIVTWYHASQKINQVVRVAATESTLTKESVRELVNWAPFIPLLSLWHTFQCRRWAALSSKAEATAFALTAASIVFQ